MQLIRPTAAVNQPCLLTNTKLYLLNSQKCKTLIIPVLALAIAVIIFYSCSYHKVDLTPACSIPATVSFKNNILPIFRTYCNQSGCHSGSMPAGHLNLEDSVAYAQLMKSGTGNIDTINPSASVLYAQMNSSGGAGLMPPTGKLDDCTLQLILTWIQQKAKNN